MKMDFSLFSQVRIANDKLRRAFDNDDSALARKALTDMVNDATKLLVMIDPNCKPLDAQPDHEPEVIAATVDDASSDIRYPSGRARQYPWHEHPRLERFLIGRYLKGDLPHISTILEMMSDAVGYEATIGQWRNKIHNHLPPQFVVDVAQPSNKMTWEKLWVAGAYLMKHAPVEGARKGDQWVRHISNYLGLDLSCGDPLPLFTARQIQQVNDLIHVSRMMTA